MTGWVPIFHETIVTDHSGADLHAAFSAATTNKPFLQSDESRLCFNGWVQADRFRISLRTRRPNPFAPLLIGRIESTPSGSILFLRYRLFANVQATSILFAIQVLLLTLFLWYQHHSLTTAAIGLGVLVVLYAVICSNFRIHLAPLRREVYKTMGTFRD